MGVISVRTSCRPRAQHVLDGFYADLKEVGFPKEAPLILFKDEPIRSTKAKSHRVFIEDKEGNGTQLTNKVENLLKEQVKMGRIRITSEQWVCAYPAQHQGGRGRRNYIDGVIHRDVNNVRGILSCIVFNNDAESGGIKIWMDSQNYESKKYDFQDYESNLISVNHIERYLDRHYEPRVIKPRRNTAIIFDGRLLHKSLSHNENYQRLAYSFFVCINGCEVDDKMDYMSKVQYRWVSSDSIKPVESMSSRNMILRSSKH